MTFDVRPEWHEAVNKRRWGRKDRAPRRAAQRRAWCREREGLLCPGDGPTGGGLTAAQGPDRAGDYSERTATSRGRRASDLILVAFLIIDRPALRTGSKTGDKESAQEEVTDVTAKTPRVARTRGHWGGAKRTDLRRRMGDLADDGTCGMGKRAEPGSRLCFCQRSFSRSQIAFHALVTNCELRPSPGTF